MNIITGYLSSTSGTVKVNGHDILEEPELAKKEIGYLPENPPLYNDMTVKEYLSFICDLKGVEKERRKNMLDNIVAMVDMAQANGIVPIISSIPPCNVFFWSEKIEDAGKTIVGINKNLKAYAEANDIVYVNYHTALTDNSFGFQKALSKDGCHPDPDTYFIMEGMVMEAIRTALKK